MTRNVTTKRLWVQIGMASPFWPRLTQSQKLSFVRDGLVLANYSIQ